MAEQPKPPRAFCVRNRETGKVISWCNSREAADKAVVRWARRCERRKVANQAFIEEVYSDKK